MNLAYKIILISLLITIQSCGGGSSTASSTGGGSIIKSNATLSWMPPTQNVDGSLLAADGIRFYRIYYGTQQDSLLLLTEISPIEFLSNTYTVEYSQADITIPNGTDIFIAMTAVSNQGVESAFSEVVTFNTQ
jgi:hypothetical protein